MIAVITEPMTATVRSAVADRTGTCAAANVSSAVTSRTYLRTALPEKVQ